MTPAGDYAISGPGDLTISVGRIVGPHITNTRFGLQVIANMLRTKAKHWAALFDYLVAYPFELFDNQPIVRGDSTLMVRYFCEGVPDRPAQFYMTTRTTKMFAEALCLYSAMAAASRWLMQYPEFGRHENLCFALDVAARKVLESCWHEDSNRAAGGRLYNSLITHRGQLTSALPYGVNVLAKHIRSATNGITAPNGQRRYPVVTEEIAARNYITALVKAHAPTGFITDSRGVRPTSLQWADRESKKNLKQWVDSELGEYECHHPYVTSLLWREADYATTDLCQSLNSFFDRFTPDTPEAAARYATYLRLLDEAVTTDHQTNFDSEGEFKQPLTVPAERFLSQWHEHLNDPVVPYAAAAWPDTGRLVIEDIMMAATEMSTAPDRARFVGLTFAVGNLISEAPSADPAPHRARIKQRMITSGAPKRERQSAGDDAGEGRRGEADPYAEREGDTRTVSESP